MAYIARLADESAQFCGRVFEIIEASANIELAVGKPPIAAPAMRPA
jgi:hypothetical protein